MMSVPVMSRRHQVGRELDALEHQAQRLRHGAHQQRLGGAGQSGDQTVAADEQRDHHLLEHLLLADDHAAHLRDDLALHLAKARDARFQNSGSNCVRDMVDMYCPFPVLDVVINSSKHLLRRPEARGGFERGQQFVFRPSSSCLPA